MQLVYLTLLFKQIFLLALKVLYYMYLVNRQPPVPTIQLSIPEGRDLPPGVPSAQQNVLLPVNLIFY